MLYICRTIRQFSNIVRHTFGSTFYNSTALTVRNMRTDTNLDSERVSDIDSDTESINSSGVIVIEQFIELIPVAVTVIVIAIVVLIVGVVIAIAIATAIAIAMEIMNS